MSRSPLAGRSAARTGPSAWPAVGARWESWSRRVPSEMTAQVLGERPQGEDGEVGESDGDQSDAGKQTQKQRRVGPKRPPGDPYDLLADQRATHAQNRDDGEEAPDQHGHGQGGQVPRAGGVDAG